MLKLTSLINLAKNQSIKMLRQIPIRTYTTSYWDLKTERAKHHQYKPNKDPLYFCLKPKGKISSPKR